ncbi:MAG: hypothetical protein WCQ95_04910 [Bacteroidota bacterium]
MKTSIFTKSLTAVAVLIFTMQLGFAANHHPDEANNLKKFMEKNVPYPEFAKEKFLSGFVVISFTVENGGEITLKAINGSTPEFKDYVETKLKSLKMDKPEKYLGKTHYYKFDFQLLSDK